MTLKERQFELVCKYQDTGDQRALAELLGTVEKLCVKLAHQLMKDPSHIDDAKQIARMSVVIAADKFDRTHESKNFAGAAYARMFADLTVFSRELMSKGLAGAKTNAMKWVCAKGKRIYEKSVLNGLSHDEAVEEAIKSFKLAKSVSDETVRDALEVVLSNNVETDSAVFKEIVQE